MVTEVVKRLTPAEAATVRAQVNAIAHAPVPALDIESGRHFVYVAHFDGTNNDKTRPELAGGAVSGEAFSTNIGLWSDLTEALERSNRRNFGTLYEKGVGTHSGENSWEAGFDPTASMKATARRAYLDFSKQASRWLAKHPEVNPEEALQVVGTGFSRGSGTLAIFSQLLYENGLVDPKTGTVLVPPGRLGLTAALALEPVTTGYMGNDAFSPTSKNIVAPRALNEYRTAFKSAAHGGHPEVTIPVVAGNHCDIGGGNDHGIGAMVGEAGLEWFRRSGLPLGDLPAARRFSGQAVIHHERDLPASVALNGAMTVGLAALGVRLRLVNRGDPAKMDYPVTNEPTQDLNAPRELSHDARQARTVGSGWSAFDSVGGTVYTKSFSHPRSGDPLEVALVRRAGAGGSHLEMYTSRLNDRGHAEATEHRSLGAAPVWEVMEVADQQMAMGAQTGLGKAHHMTTLTPRLYTQVTDQVRVLGEEEGAGHAAPPTHRLPWAEHDALAR